MPDFRLGPRDPAGKVSVLAVTSARGKVTLKIGPVSSLRLTKEKTIEIPSLNTHAMNCL